MTTELPADTLRRGQLSSGDSLLEGTESHVPAPIRRKAFRSRFWRNWAILGVLVGLALLGDLVWERSLRDRIIPKRWGVVVPGKIYRSGQLSEPLLSEMLTKHRIQTIVNLQGIDPNDLKQAAEAKFANVSGIDQFRCSLGGDGLGAIENYAAALKVIRLCETAGKPVLVHCAAGAQRTGGVVAAYRVLIEQDSPQRAYAEMKSYGWKPDRDQILITYLNSHMARLAKLLVDEGVLEQVPEQLPVIGP